MPDEHDACSSWRVKCRHQCADSTYALGWPKHGLVRWGQPAGRDRSVPRSLAVLAQIWMPGAATQPTDCLTANVPQAWNPHACGLRRCAGAYTHTRFRHRVLVTAGSHRPRQQTLDLSHYIAACRRSRLNTTGTAATCIGRHDWPCCMRFQVSRTTAWPSDQSSCCHCGTTR